MDMDAKISTPRCTGAISQSIVQLMSCILIDIEQGWVALRRPLSWYLSQTLNPSQEPSRFFPIFHAQYPQEANNHPAAKPGNDRETLNRLGDH